MDKKVTTLYVVMPNDFPKIVSFILVNTQHVAKINQFTENDLSQTSLRPACMFVIDRCLVCTD